MKNAMLAIVLLIALTGQTPQQHAVRHLEYRFGYNTKAADSGQGTGTTTIDIVGPAEDGGIIVNASDFWWNTPRARQTHTCEVYPNGGVTCVQAPHALSPIQLVVVPLLAKNYFASLSGVGSSWTQSYNVRATFAPAAHSGYMGQVYTWNCSYEMNAKKNVGNGTPFVLVGQKGKMKQEGGRHIIVNQDGNVVLDPGTKVPVHVFQHITFTPKLSVDYYTVDLILKKHTP